MKKNKAIISILSSDGANMAKVIATFCVVLTHSYKLFEYIGRQESELFYLRGFHAFAACGVPVFFLLSGYFLVFKDNWDYKKNTKKKVKSLLIPFCCFILLYTFISIIGSLFLHGFFDDFKSFTVWDWLMHLVGIPFVTAPVYYGPLWFVRDLFILNIFSFFLVPIVRRVPSWILIPAMCVIYFLPISQLVRYSIPFFVVGMKFGFDKKIPVANRSSLIIALFLIAFFVPIIFEGELAWKIGVFFMVGFILSISGNLIEKNIFYKAVNVAIPFSFPVYLLHEYPMTSLMRLLALKGIPISLAVVAFFVAPFIIICACVIVAKVWQRLFPRSYALCMGGR